MKSLLIYLKGYRKETVLSPLFKLFEAGLELTVPLVMAALIDRGITAGESGFIVRMCLLLAGLALAGLVSSITAQYFAAKAAAGFGKEVRRALFAKVQSLSFSDLDTVGVSTLETRLTSDSNQAQTGVNLTLRLLLRSPFIVFGAAIMAFTVDARAALVFAAAIPVLAAIIFAVMLISVPLYRAVQGRLDRILGATRQNLAGARVVRAFNLESNEVASFERENDALMRMQNRVGRLSALLNPATYVVINLAIAALIWSGALRVNAGLLTQGGVVALYNYMGQILVELVKLASLIITVTKAVASGNRIRDVLEMSPSMTAPAGSPAPDATAPAVEFFGVGLRYHACADEALSGVTFTARRGETVGVIGGTGAGKSSLVGLIPRFYDASEGVVRVLGADVKDYPLGELRGKIGVVPQNAALFSGTVRENMSWGKEDATDGEIRAALKTAQVLDVVDEKGGLDFVVAQGGKNLSGGQRQRLTIARALVRRPEILILDDSASALDYATDAALRRAIRAMEGAPTVFIVSQRASSVLYADSIVVLDDGKPVGIGTSEELLRTCPIYREIYETQFEREAAHA
ncbi:MAG: ABC transporter ATP-binding protein [Clostridiales bacterium]|nr:ABC transporter ATP-binding protein [Clostridiales bacterium]